MSRFVASVVVVVSLIAVSGCGAEPKSGKGFTLPDGNVERGQQVFVEMQCHACHSIKGVKFPEFDADPEPQYDVNLGGRVQRIQTYGELVTSIINPSHRLAKGFAFPTESTTTSGTPDSETAEPVNGQVENATAAKELSKGKSDAVSASDKASVKQKPQSPMTNYNDVMTVSQLIDLVAFLQSHYELIKYEAHDYPDYF